MTAEELAQFCLPNRNKALKYAGQFLHIFGIRLKPLWSNITGIDIIAFDKKIGTPLFMSTSDYVAQKYGEEAVELLRALL